MQVPSLMSRRRVTDSCSRCVAAPTQPAFADVSDLYRSLDFDLFTGQIINIGSYGLADILSVTLYAAFLAATCLSGDIRDYASSADNSFWMPRQL